MAPDPNPATRFEWERTILTLALPSTTKLVALVLASYTDAKTGEHAHPGEDRLATDCGLADRVVRRHLFTLRHLRLVERTWKGRANQYRRMADEYALAIPENVEEHLDRYRTLATGSKPLCCRTLSTPLPDSGVLGTGRQSVVVPDSGVRPSPKTTDVYQPKTNLIIPAAQSTDRTHEVEEKQLCEICRSRIAADGECLACRHMNVRSA
jgi:DNA-binding transcriptional ArsR family regulator